MRGSTLAIRADANIRIGTGHVMRCLALAQAWQDAGGNVVFLCSDLPPRVGDRLQRENVSTRVLAAVPGSLADAHETAAIAAELNVEWLLVDGFHFDETFFALLHAGGISIMLMDDHASRRRYPAEIVLNPNIFASPEMYRDISSEAVLAGPEYALLRREFRARTSPAGVSTERNRLLVTMGGSDPDGVTLRILAALNRITEPLEISILSGGLNPHLASLRGAVLHSAHPARLLTDVADMPGLLSSVDMAISAPGGTCFELAIMGVPILLVTIAKNHERTAQEFAARGMAASIGWCDRLTVSELAANIEKFVSDAPLRQNLAAKALNLIDGCGAERVVRAMLTQYAKVVL